MGTPGSWAMAPNNPVMRMLQDLLCKFNAELSEVFSCWSQVVTDDGHVLLNVKNDRGDIGALVTNVLHVLPLHLKTETGGDKPLDTSQEDSLTCSQGRSLESRNEATACYQSCHFVSGNKSYPVSSGWLLIKTSAPTLSLTVRCDSGIFSIPVPLMLEATSFPI